MEPSTGNWLTALQRIRLDRLLLVVLKSNPNDPNFRAVIAEGRKAVYLAAAEDLPIWEAALEAWVEASTQVVPENSKEPEKPNSSGQ